MSAEAPTCPVCASRAQRLYARSEDVEYFTGLGRFDFYRCERCDILHIWPMLADRLGEIYPASYYSFAAGRASPVERVKEWLDQRNFRRIAAAIPGDALSALDVGGGSGWLMDRLKAADRRFTETWVADIDPDAQHLAERAGHRFALGPFDRFQPDRSFDFIAMLNFIEHVPDPVATLRHAAGMLAPNGRLLLKTPNFDALDARLFRHRSWGGYHTPRHFVLFNEASIRRACETAGLHVAGFHYTQGAPFWSVSVLDLLRRAGLARVDRDRPAVRHPLMPALQAGFAAFDFARRAFSKLSQMEVVLSPLP